MAFRAVLGDLDWKIFFVAKVVILVRKKHMNHFWKVKSNPAFTMYFLQILEGQFSGFHFVIAFLNFSRSSIFLWMFGSIYQTFGSK